LGSRFFCLPGEAGKPASKITANPAQITACNGKNQITRQV